MSVPSAERERPRIRTARQIEDECLHPDEAAQALGLPRSTVFKLSACREGGEDALRAKPGPGSPELIRRDFWVALSAVSVGRLPRKLGLSPQRPLWRAWQQDPAAVERWKCEEFPAIKAEAERQRNRKYSHAQWEFTSTGYRCPLRDGDVLTPGQPDSPFPA